MLAKNSMFVLIGGKDYTLSFPKLQGNEFSFCTGLIRVTSLEQLSLAEFSGEKARPNVYENSHKKVLGF